MDFSLRLLPIHAYCIPIPTMEGFLVFTTFVYLLCLTVVPESTYANAAVSYSSMVLGKTTVVKRKP